MSKKLHCPRPNRECEGACKSPGCAVCPQCNREFSLEEGEAPGTLCCVCKIKIVVIVGGTREAAYQRLKKIASDNGIVHQEYYDEVELDGHRIVAIGGELDDVCWLVELGFCIEEIITVEDADISEPMRRRINHVRSTV